MELSPTMANVTLSRSATASPVLVFLSLFLLLYILLQLLLHIHLPPEDLEWRRRLVRPWENSREGENRAPLRFFCPIEERKEAAPG